MKFLSIPNTFGTLEEYKTMFEKEKLLITNIFSYPHSVVQSLPCYVHSNIGFLSEIVKACLHVFLFRFGQSIISQIQKSILLHKE